LKPDPLSHSSPSSIIPLPQHCVGVGTGVGACVGGVCVGVWVGGDCVNIVGDCVGIVGDCVDIVGDCVDIVGIDVIGGLIGVGPGIEVGEDEPVGA
jgi:hypothetical protein